MKGSNRAALTFLVLALLLGAAVLVSIMFGGSSIPAPQVIGALVAPESAGNASSIVWKIRLPRILLGIIAGMGLAASGCVFQGMLRNPLADPYTLGISGGAALGTAVATVTGLAAVSVFFLPGFAFLGTIACIALVYLVTARQRFSTHTLILAGVILGFIFSSLVMLVFALSDPRKIGAVIFWLMGDLSSAPAGLTRAAAFFVVPGVLLLSVFGRELNILTLGDEKAAHLGVESERVKKIVFVLASVITGACVSAAGVIGFVGLMIPHLMRRLTGPDHRLLIPASALGGAVFLPLCDTLARTVIAPVELPVGVITGFIGGLFFLFFLSRSGGRNSL